MVERGGEAVGVQARQGMYLGFAQVAPPAGDAAFGELAVAFAQPGAGVGIGDVKHSAFADPNLDFLVVAEGVLEHEVLFLELVVVVDSAAVAQDVGLGDGHQVDTFFLELAQHALGVGPLLGIPCEASHVLFLAIPVEVEHDAVEGIAGALEGVDHSECLGLVMVAVFGCNVAEAPERREVLTACERRELLGDVGEGFGAVDEVVAYWLGILGDVLDGVVKNHFGAGIVVEEDCESIARKEQRHGDVHLRDAGI